MTGPFHSSQKIGTLYIVSTPIGNLEDLTFRALRVLKECALIAAESVTRTKGLCQHYGIRTKVTRYHQHNSKSKSPELIEHLKAGEDIAVVTDAGTPGISDPGGMLVELARAEGLHVEAVPGPSAVTAALAVSGMPTDRFVFLGFLPSRPGKRRKELEKLRAEQRTMVFFEAPHRIEETLAEMLSVLGERKVVVARELTKTFEQVKGGMLSSVLGSPDEIPIRGEFTVVLKGADLDSAPQEPPKDRGAWIDTLLAQKKSLREIATIISEKEGLPYRRVYKECLTQLRRSKEVDDR